MTLQELYEQAKSLVEDGFGGFEVLFVGSHDDVHGTFSLRPGNADLDNQTWDYAETAEEIKTATAIVLS